MLFKSSCFLALQLAAAFGAMAGLSAPRPAVAQTTSAALGSFAKWQCIEIALVGPESQALGQPNPFQIRLDGVFTGPSGRTTTVPGFYDGNGRRGRDGNVWKVRFSADELGDWTFRSQSNSSVLDDQSRSFTVTAPPPDAADFYRWGRLESIGTAENRVRYLKFRDGPYWLKAGCDDPENFLGNYSHYDTLEERREAIDYLAQRGVNSLYVMTHNIQGDDNDVWPWLGETARQAKRHAGPDSRFDVARLDQWREVFEYMQQRGVVVYLVLEDDSAWKGYDHARYYREMVARFGYLPALVFNMGEEHNENYRLSEALDWMRQLAEIDAFDHPRGIHNVNTPDDDYIDAPQIDLTSIQTGSPGSHQSLENALQHNRIAIDWIRRCQARGQRTLMVNFDEGRPELQRAAWWAAYLAGGVWEAHVLPPYDRPMAAWESTWNQLGGARAFMESLPFWTMHPHNQLVKDGHAVCLADPGAAYALYLPHGGSVTVELASPAQYVVAWWNPANDRQADFQDTQRVPGGMQQFTAPGNGDWAVRITRTDK